MFLFLHRPRVRLSACVHGARQSRAHEHGVDDMRKLRGSKPALQRVDTQAARAWMPCCGRVGQNLQTGCLKRSIRPKTLRSAILPESRHACAQEHTCAHLPPGTAGAPPAWKSRSSRRAPGSTCDPRQGDNMCRTADQPSPTNSAATESHDIDLQQQCHH